MSNLSASDYPIHECRDTAIRPLLSRNHLGSGQKIFQQAHRISWELDQCCWVCWWRPLRWREPAASVHPSGWAAETRCASLLHRESETDRQIRLLHHRNFSLLNTGPQNQALYSTRNQKAMKLRHQTVPLLINFGFRLCIYPYTTNERNSMALLLKDKE